VEVEAGLRTLVVFLETQAKLTTGAVVWRAGGRRGREGGGGGGRAAPRALLATGNNVGGCERAWGRAGGCPQAGFACWVMGRGR